jgi:hypothetical protein
MTTAPVYADYRPHLTAFLTDLPGPASDPGVAPPMPLAGVFFAILAIVVPSLFVSFGLLLYGMRGAATER